MERDRAAGDGHRPRAVGPGEIASTDDRRRMTISLTDRGRAAAKAVRAGIEAVDAELSELLSPAESGPGRCVHTVPGP